MDRELIRRLFPNASESTFAANGAAHPKLQNRREKRCVQDSGGSSELERNPGNGALGKSEAKTRDTARFLVRVTSIRKRLTDTDNLCVKFVIDACRYAGIIHGDSPAQTTIEMSQRKAKKSEEEHTLIEIYTL